MSGMQRSGTPVFLLFHFLANPLLKWGKKDKKDNKHKIRTQCCTLCVCVFCMHNVNSGVHSRVCCLALFPAPLTFNLGHHMWYIYTYCNLQMCTY